jgi:hypothetical protein
MFWKILFSYEAKAYKIKFRFDVYMRFRVHRYVAAPPMLYPQSWN